MTQAVQHFPRLREVPRLARVSPATAFAIRYGTAASAAVWLGHTPGLVESQSKWILITVLVVAQPMAGGSLQKAILRSFGTLAAFCISIVLFGLFSQDPPLLLAGLFLVQAVGAYGFTGPRHQYAWYVFAFTTGVILGDSLTGVGEVETVAFERASMVGLGILIVLVVDALFWPTRSEESLRRSLAERARGLSEALRGTAQTPLGPQDPHVEAAGSASSPVAGQLGLVAAARSEPGVSPARAESLTRIALVLEALASRERVLRQSLAAVSGSASAWAPFAALLAELGRGVESALAQSAEALAADRAPTPFARDLERTLVRLEAERQSAPTRAQADAAVSQAAALRDLVALLRTLEECLVGLASESEAAGTSISSPARAAIRLQLDPFRVQIALRTGIAVCAALVLALALGWDFNNLIPPVAFMLAAVPTRGGALQAAVGFAGACLLAWLVADLAIVYFAPHVSRLPLALLMPFALAGVLGYVTASRPQLEALRKMGGLLALLPVFAGVAAPSDVEGAYDTMCYAGLAAAVGWACTRVLWPATAAALFRERAAEQLDLCGGALREGEPPLDPTARSRQAAQLLAAFTKQRAQLGSLHGQARHEPVERSLDEPRRVELLALIQDLFDTVLAARGRAPGQAAALLERGGSALAPVREALSRLDAALLASMQTAADWLRRDAATPSSDLAQAREAIEARIAELRARPEPRPAPDPREREAFLVQLDMRRQLVTRQLAIEQFLLGR